MSNLNRFKGTNLINLVLGLNMRQSDINQNRRNSKVKRLLCHLSKFRAALPKSRLMTHK